MNHHTLYDDLIFKTLRVEKKAELRHFPDGPDCVMRSVEHSFMTPQERQRVEESMKMIRVGVNGYPGRIAKCLVRQFAGGLHIGDRPNIELVAINAPAKPHRLLLDLTQHDSVHGRFGMSYAQQAPGVETWLEDGCLCIGETRLYIFDTRQAPNWGDQGVDIVFDCTGQHCNSQRAMPHLDQGTKKFVISAPPKGGSVDRVSIWGINHGQIQTDDRVISLASCTTTALAPVAKAMRDAGIGIKLGWMTSFHAATASNAAVDGADIKDQNRGRSIIDNFYQTSTGAARMIGEVMPELKGRLTGTALRGPWSNGSMLQLSFIPEREDVTEEDVRRALISFSVANPAMMATTDRPTVVTDIITLPQFVITDLTTIQVQRAPDGSQLITVSGWYDNEWGYAEASGLALNYLAGQMLGV